MKRFFVASLLSLVPGMASATMMPDGAMLPLSASDMEAAKAALGNDTEALNRFVGVLAGVKFYPDHTNPRDLAGLDNPSRVKTFYAAPFFQPSAERGAIGSQEIAVQALNVLDAADKLFESLGYKVGEVQRLKVSIESKEKFIQNLQTRQAATGASQADRDYLSGLITQVRADIANIDAKLTALFNEGRSENASIPSDFERQVFSQVTYQFARLGIVPSDAEKTALQTGNYEAKSAVVNALRARASRGQMGIRQAIFEHGFNSEQRQVFALYKRLRPDVAITSLSPNAVLAKSTVETYMTAQSPETPEYTLPLLMVRGVNAGSQGKCGNAQACNVVVEYTEVGARTALLSTAGGVVLPVTFEADVNQTLPDFDGTVSCHFENGFRSNGRLDVKDGGIIYDGDVTNKISVTGVNTGGCKFIIRKGDEAAAAYAALKEIFSKYTQIQSERVVRSAEDKRRYEEYLASEAQRHINRSQQPEQESIWSRVTTWAPVFGSTWGTVAAFTVSSARSFYWHTRIEDRTSIDRVDVDTDITLSNVQAVKRVSFDGFPHACWKQLDGKPVLTACPVGAAVTTEAERAQINEAALCTASQSVGDCAATVASQPVDNSGVVTPPENPW